MVTPQFCGKTMIHLISEPLACHQISRTVKSVVKGRALETNIWTLFNIFNIFLHIDDQNWWLLLLFMVQSQGDVVTTAIWLSVFSYIVAARCARASACTEIIIYTICQLLGASNRIFFSLVYLCAKLYTHSCFQ